MSSVGASGALVAVRAEGRDMKAREPGGEPRGVALLVAQEPRAHDALDGAEHRVRREPQVDAVAEAARIPGLPEHAGDEPAPGLVVRGERSRDRRLRVEAVREHEPRGVAGGGEALEHGAVERLERGDELAARPRRRRSARARRETVDDLARDGGQEVALALELAGQARGR